MAKVQVENRYYRTRKMMRDYLRKKFGNAGLRSAWHKYQVEQGNAGKRKLFVETKIEWEKR